MDYFLKEAPFRKKVTSVLQQSFRDRVYHVPHNFSSSPSPTLPVKTKTLKPKGLTVLDKIIRSDHKINSKKVQILKLPKLPFGKHSNYNNEDLFVSNHFVELESTEKTKELDEAIKKFRLFEKKYKKSLSNSPDKIATLERKKNYFVYSTQAGKLVVHKDRNIIRQYEENKKEYSHLRNLSFQFIPDFDSRPSTDRVQENNRSVKDIIKRLYPSPKPQSNRIFESLSSKFSRLFEDSEI
jgi:hypothetical protein